MRIAIAIPAFLPARGYGGPIEKVLGLGGGLLEHGVEVEVVTSTLAGPGEPSLPEGADVAGGLPVWRVPTPSSLGWGPLVRWRPPRVAPDLVHVVGVWNSLSYAAAAWATARRIPWIWEPTGMMAPVGRRRALKLALSGPNLLLASASAGIVWTSPQERAEAPLPFRFVRHWLRANPVAGDPSSTACERGVARRDLDLPVDGPLWGYLGRIAHRKGIDRLLGLWAKAAAPGHLCLAGPVEDESALERLRVAAPPRVRLLGPLDADRRWTFLRALDALVLIPRRGENFGNVVAEAVAVGTPALVSKAVGAAHWLDGYGATVVGPPFGRLHAIFRGAPLPDGPVRLPDRLRPRAVVKEQLAIYREVLGA